MCSSPLRVHSGRVQRSWAGGELQQHWGEQGWELFKSELLKSNRGLNKHWLCNDEYRVLNAFPYQAVGVISSEARLSWPF